MAAKAGEVPMQADAQGIPPPEMEPAIAAGMYAAATAAAPAETEDLQTGAPQRPPFPRPPGMAPPLDPNNPNMPVMAFMQLMNQQMQTFMQSMQTQMQSQTVQATSNTGSVQNRLDER